MLTFLRVTYIITLEVDLMKKIQEQAFFFEKLMDLLEQHFGYSCEIVLHDLTKDYDHTIIDIRNGHITGRRVGDCGSNLGLEVLRGTESNDIRCNYITQTREGKTLRSSSLYFKDDNGKVIGSLCINTDITESLRYEAYLHAFNSFNPETPQQSQEVFAADIKQLLEHLLAEGERIVGKSAGHMNKQDRDAFIRYLDQKGAFLITKSSERVCEFLGVSKYTLYTTLDKLRNGEKDANQQQEEAESNGYSY